MSLDPTQPVSTSQPGSVPPSAIGEAQPGKGQSGETFQPAAPEPGGHEVLPQAVVAAKPVARGGGMSLINIALGVALVIAVAGVAFAAGRLTAPATAAATGGSGRTFPGGGNFPGGGDFGGGPGGYFGGRNGGFGGGANGGASIQGTVTAVGPDSITITTAGGQAITIGLDSATTYHQQSSATSGDVKTGGTVIVRLGFRGQDGPTASGAPRLSATDVTVVP